MWKDKKPVYFLSTQSNPVGDLQVNRRQRDGSIIHVPSVPVVKSYNNNMGGIIVKRPTRFSTLINDA